MNRLTDIATKIIPSTRLSWIDEQTINHQAISYLELMERASTAFVEHFITQWDTSWTCYIFVGTGNNGGDALAIARQLHKKEYTCHVCLALHDKTRSEACQYNLDKLRKLNIPIVDSYKDLPSINHPNAIIIDGLFGVGLNRPVKGITSSIIHFMNEQKAYRVAIDIPSGLFGEDNTQNSGAIFRADETFTFHFPKLSFFFLENYRYVGKWKILDIGLDKKSIEKEQVTNFYSTDLFIRKILKKRDLFSHKKDYGHLLLMAGKRGKMGAAILASKGALRSGVGLLTVHTPMVGAVAIQTAVPEAMVSFDKQIDFISHVDIEGFDTIAIGPGIGQHKPTKHFLALLLKKHKGTLVIDADAINLLVDMKEELKQTEASIILTPHIGEIERLIGKQKSAFHRYNSVVSFAKKYNVTIVLKGAYTSVITPEGYCYFNSTGNPGMATGGSGDVLTGIIGSLLSQKYNEIEAAILGVFLHGKAGDLFVTEYSEEGLIASDLCNYLPAAFKSLEKREVSEETSPKTKL